MSSRRTLEQRLAAIEAYWLKLVGEYAELEKVAYLNALTAMGAKARREAKLLRKFGEGLARAGGFGKEP